MTEKEIDQIKKDYDYDLACPNLGLVSRLLTHIDYLEKEICLLHKVIEQGGDYNGYLGKRANSYFFEAQDIKRERENQLNDNG